MIEDKLDALKETGDATLIQAKLTNGRVSKLENWQAYVIGFCVAISVLLLPILFIVLKLAFKQPL